jgi:hypothetical protein
MIKSFDDRAVVIEQYKEVISLPFRIEAIISLRPHFESKE